MKSWYLRLLLLLGLMVAFLKCQPAQLAETSYGTLDNQSINGRDALIAMASARSQKTLRSSWLTSRVRQDADLVIYFERDARDHPEEYYQNMEAWLWQKQPEDLELRADSPDSENKADEQDTEDPDAADPKFENSQQVRSQSGQHTGRLASATKDPLKHNAKTPSPGQIRLPTLAPSDSEFNDEKQKTVLYFLRDTNSNVAFYERVVHDLQGYPAEQNYVQEILDQEQNHRISGAIGKRIPFGEWQKHISKGPLLRASRLVIYPTIFPDGVDYYPVRHVPSEPQSVFNGLKLQYRNLLASAEGYALIREVDFPRVQFILVYNSEAFLNYSLVRPAYRRLYSQLLDYATRKLSRKPVLALIERGLVPPHQADNQELAMWRVFTIYPLNLILAQFVIFLLFFLYHKWPHQQRPRSMPPSGSRAFLEHFKALGTHLSRSRSREEILGRLMDYRQEKGLDTSIIESNAMDHKTESQEQIDDKHK